MNADANILSTALLGVSLNVDKFIKSHNDEKTPDKRL
jgi:hypothetical protein